MLDLLITLAAAPLVIAHRGASGERPEHTIAAYTLAIEQGADFIEPDLVMTKDGVLVARHENEIGGTTDVADRREFAGRRTTKTVDGREVAGWFVEDFTLAELKTLRARERLPSLRPASAGHDGRYEVPTFAEVVALAKARKVGVYPETKHPSYFRRLGLPLEETLLTQLTAAGWSRARDPVFIQSFEVGNLQALRRRTKLRLVQLIDADGGPADRPGTSYASMVTPAGLKAIAGYANAVGVAKSLIVPRGRDNRSAAATSLVRDAHAAKLQVHAWTFRAENIFLPAELQRGAVPGDAGDLTSELKTFYAAGVDGVFSDFPAAAVRARSR